MEVEMREVEALEECPLCHLPKKLYKYGKGKLCHDCIMDMAYMKRKVLDKET